MGNWPVRKCGRRDKIGVAVGEDAVGGNVVVVNGICGLFAIERWACSTSIAVGDVAVASVIGESRVRCVWSDNLRRMDTCREVEDEDLWTYQ